MEGDLVAVLPGGKVPYILRSHIPENTSSGRQFTVLGDAYVHGIMDGEAFDM